MSAPKLFAAIAILAVALSSFVLGYTSIIAI
jgi:hypothetical protein